MSKAIDLVYEMIFQWEMIIFRMVSYKSLGFGALIFGSNSLLIIKDLYLQMLYINFFQYFYICIILRYR